MQKNIEIMSLEQLQKHNVKLVEIWQYANGRYGFNNDFFRQIQDSYATGYTPKDMFLITNLNYLLDKVDERLKLLYTTN